MQFRSSIKIRLELEKGIFAEVEFRKQRKNELLKAQAEDESSAVKSVLDLIIGLTGIENDAGEPMSVDEFKALAQDDIELFGAVVWGYTKAMEQLGSKEHNEKKYGGIVS